MIEKPRYGAILKRLGIADGRADRILSAVEFSDKRLKEARAAVARLDFEGMSAAALGSLGRYEAGEPSDLDLAFVYDPEYVWPGRARVARRELRAALVDAGFDIPEKTFFEPISIDALTRDVGGSRETNAQLTYRALLLTEGAFIWNKSVHEDFRSRIFGAYAKRPNTAGRHLTSLANDLHRYYRTLCVDYRWKVEEQGKHWAIRLLKLRHSRKLWHVANIATQCLYLLHDDAAAEVAPLPGAEMSADLQQPPLIRIAAVLDRVDASDAIRSIFVAYDQFLAELAKKSVREELEAIDYAARKMSEVFKRLDENAKDLQTGINRFLANLCEDETIHDYVRRFVIT